MLKATMQKQTFYPIQFFFFENEVQPLVWLFHLQITVTSFYISQIFLDFIVLNSVHPAVVWEVAFIRLQPTHSCQTFLLVPETLEG